MTDRRSSEMTQPTLVVTGGPLDGSSYVIVPQARPLSLGSQAGSDIHLELGNVEPAHATLELGTHGLVLSDNKSAAGTFVNGEKIGARHGLNDGDRICLGPPGSKSSAKLVVRIPSSWVPPQLMHEAAGDHPLVLTPPDAGTGPVFGREAPAPPLAAPPPLAPPPPAPPPPPVFVAPPPAPGVPPPPPPAAVAPPPPPPAMSVPPPPPPPAVLAPPSPLAPPPPAPPPAPLTAPPVETRRARPEYTSEPPSIMGSSSGEVSRLPPPGRETKGVKKATPARKTPHRVRRPGAALKVAASSLLAVALVGGGYWIATNLLRRPPRAEGIMPDKAVPGGTVTISGRGFDSDPTKNIVRFGDQVGTVVSATSTQLTAIVPAGLAPTGSASLPVVIETRAGASKALSLLVHRPPQVSGVRPDIAMPGDLVTITGDNLDGQPLTVSIGGMTAEVKSAEPGTLAVVVPSLPVTEGREVQVQVQIGAEWAKPGRLLMGRLPLVTEVAPSQGPAAQRVVIKGRGFDASPAGNLVSFGAQPAVVLTASATELTVAAPAPPLGETQAKVPVTVRANGSTSSSPATFVLTRVSATTFVPRFFVTSAAEDGSGALVFVSTDLGPVLVLGGKGSAASTAERALGVASALNALVAEAPTRPPAFELRSDGAPAVGVVGSAPALVTATADDAAAYDRPWEGQRGRRGASPRLVAQHWTALLQDYFTLFVLRQRPVKSLELSPQGKVLSGLYAEALRAAGAGNGVPTRLVIPPSTALTKGLRELALLLPKGAPRAGAALEGLWEGTLAEGAATRRIKVRLRYEGSRLAGSLSTQAGRVEMNTSLKSVSFERGDLRFTVDISGAAHAFRGTLQGEVITGSVQRGSDRTSPGTFTLKLVE